MKVIGYSIENGERANPFETFYECDSFSIGEKNHINVVLIIRNKGVEKMFELSKKFNDVYIMCGDGKTIDSYKWED